MKFTLKDYQSDAVRDVLINLKKARKRWHEENEKNSFSLTATTGAGKTVMAAAVFETLFFGNDDYDFEPDRGAAVIWFSDDPSLNTQSRHRLTEASDKLTISQLVTVENTFNRDKFEAGKIYFLNTQKLSKKSLLVRGAEADETGDADGSQQNLPMPDLRAHTIWDTIQNTIEDPDLTLYLVLDEAHRGMKEGGADSRTTIVKQLIDGKGSVPGIPIVWGISATVERFNKAMQGLKDRERLRNVVVDSAKVQESGLLKDTINLDVPDEAGEFATVLLRRGTNKLRDVTKAWQDYVEEQRNEADKVVPLMVLQVPNSPDRDEIGEWLQTVFDTWPELPSNCVANVFGEHKTETYAGRNVHYVEPERVQESEWIRILLAKDAISTGWDCPRAEVMVSFRAATDKTHITQLLGRMIRSPLARRIPGNERLNSVDCLLPYFNEKAVADVVAALSGGDSGEPLPGRRILINPREMTPNPNVTEAVWEKLLSLPSQALPKRQARPVKRLTILAHELAADGLRPNAGKIAHAEMHKVLDAARVRHAEKIKAARSAVLTVEGKTVRTNVATKEMSFDDFVEAADNAVIDDAYKRAARMISPDLARTYADHLASKEFRDEEDPVDALMEARTVVASIGLVAEIKDYLESEAEVLSNKSLTEYRVRIKDLSDERQDVYREIREMSSHPLDVDLARPTSWLQPSTIREADGSEFALPRYDGHLLCDDDRRFPANLNNWEERVLVTELGRNKYVAWYRNPDRASQDSLGITYEVDGETKIVRPDFIFFASSEDGGIVADIVDPHGFHLADALAKLQGLARYAESSGGAYRRVECVAVLNDQYKVLDLQEERVRETVLSATSAKSLYDSPVAEDYVPDV